MTRASTSPSFLSPLQHSVVVSCRLNMSVSMNEAFKSPADRAVP